LDKPSLDEELKLWSAGFTRIAGLDEAGRGAWAGPVVAGAVVLPADAAIAQRLEGVADSKQVPKAKREALYGTIMQEAAAVGVGVVHAVRIDAVGIVAATRQAMQQAIQQLLLPPDFLLIDYLRLPYLATPQRALTKGDCRVLSIAAASIVAKVTRDRLMVELAGRYHQYGFERNKGYGTAVHSLALAHHGPCAEHRRSFEPVRGRQPRLFPGEIGERGVHQEESP